ncbi:hypothetical protein THITH_01900 [Thioalkalivibrio paradoxus ARh 1]|uniref:Uncharacterized protein n=1 Tax=Thioalkalivibrio paradoxus ARh 1 TaxID=713585 RepID=W0DN32_9GAMM|nr:hypothetical protein THITH_01900 [Thioalkalivibrio paradoxus ARh 1]
MLKLAFTKLMKKTLLRRDQLLGFLDGGVLGSQQFRNILLSMTLDRQEKLKPLDIANIDAFHGLADYVIPNLNLQVITLQCLVYICASL